MDTTSCDDLNQEKINQPEVTRIVNTFPPSMWGDYFINFTLDNKLWEKYSAEDEELKEQVRSMLVYEERKLSEKMVLIDTLERLGLAYHFDDEIEEILKQLFDNFQCNENYDLYNVALHFRIFRKYGYKMSCDVFNKFKGNDGKLKETLINDVKGMLSLYEAANLATHGDDILEEALVFTKTHLQAMIPNLSSDLANKVKRSLNLCLHKSLPRIEARNYIDVYGNDPLKNETLLRFAKIDYNLLQLLHLQELKGISEWWNELTLKLPYARDRIVECFFISLAVHFEPHYSVARTTLAKMIGMTSRLDDTFDSYGTLDELEVFRDSVEKWDSSGLQQLPDYYNLLYKSLLNLFEELEQQFMPQGRSYGLSLVKQEEADEKAFHWLQNKPKVFISCATIGRLLDDIGTYEVERARGQIATGIECYMYQYNVSKKDAINEFNHRIDQKWKDLNEECLKPTPVSKHLLERLVNFSRLMEVAYRKGDGYTHPEHIIADVIVSLLKNPIPLA